MGRTLTVLGTVMILAAFAALTWWVLSEPLPTTTTEVPHGTR